MGYLRRLEAMGKKLKAITHIIIRHDDDCTIWRTYVCSCTPVI